MTLFYPQICGDLCSVGFVMRLPAVIFLATLNFVTCDVNVTSDMKDCWSSQNSSSKSSFSSIQLFFGACGNSKLKLEHI